MANRQFLINYHTSGAENMPLSGDVKLGEIIVRHNDQKPELLLLKDNGSFAKFIDSVAINTLIDSAKTNLEGQIDAVVSNLEQNYATSANTVAAIESVDAKFANYATSAATVAAIESVDDKFANYANSAATVAAIKVVQDGVDAVDKKLVEGYATSASTVAAIKTVDNKFANYATSAATVAAIESVDAKFANYATSADTAAAIKVVQDGVDSVAQDLETAVSSLTETINNKVSAAFIYKGTKNNFSELPLTGNVKGDVWNVVNANGNIPAGTNYAWDGSAWDALAGTVDLTIFATSAATVAAIKVVQDGVDAVDKKLVEGYATSADTASAIKAVDNKFANYATSAATVAAIESVDEKFASYATSAATVAAIKVVQDGVDAVDKKLVEGYATSADTAAAIKSVDNKFANYATSADTAAAIKSVDNKFANYATSADTAAAIKVVQDGVDAIDLRVDKLEALSATTSSAVQSIEISGITGVSAIKVGTKYTIDFTNMVIDGGSF